MAVDIKKTGVQSPTGSWKPNGAPKVKPLGTQANPYGPWAGAGKAPNPVPYKKK